MWQSSLWYIFPTALAVLLCFVIAWHAWRLRPRRGAGYVALLMLVVAWWSLTSIFEIVSATLPAKLCWVKIEYPAIAFIGIAWFLLMREYLGQAPRLSRRALAVTCLIPMLTVLLAWTNGWHHLMYTRAYLDARFTIPILVFERGIWFWLFYVYLCGLVLLGVAYGLQGWLYAHPLYRRQLLAMLGGGFFPFLVNLAYVFHPGISPLLDFTPLAFAITGIVLLWGVRRYQLWDITPIARTTVFERLADGVMVIDIEHRLVDINQEGARILGVPRASLIGTSFAQLAIVWPALADLNLDNVEETVVLEQHQDPPRIFHGRMTPLLTPTEQVGGWTLVLHDMTEQHEFTRQLAAMAYYDTITGLPNRRLFQERLEEALEQIHGTALSVGVIFIDIDRFKQINDTLGHAVGDTVLRCVAEQFDLCLNDTDTVARLGGDEFIIVLPDIHGRRDLYQTACRILERFEAPLIIGKHRLRLTPSLGLTIAPEQGTTVERLIIQADLAMYQAKQNGRNTFAFYTPKQEPQYALSEHPN